jgi:hypothetical protein
VTAPALIFLGPSLPLARARPLLDAHYLPPVRQGDLYRAVRRWRPRLVGIVDGYFHEVPAVWHREILWAMREGVHVLGAASMGALRAAELHALGMRGVGRIFQAYRDGVFAPYGDAFEDDDEVALLHGPAETGFVALSDALVDIRDALSRAAVSGVIDIATARRLVALGKATNYRERRIADIIANPAARLDAATGRHLADWAAANPMSCKGDDARLMIITMAELASIGPPPFVAPFRFEEAAVWHRFVAAEGGHEDPLCVVEAGVLTEARLDPALWHEARRAAALRQAALAMARRRAPSPPSHAGRAGRDRLRRALGLAAGEALTAWMRQNALDDAACERLLRDDAELDALADANPPSDRAVLDYLRMAGRFAELAERHGDKAARLAERLETEAALDLAPLIDWFSTERCGDTLALPTAEMLAAKLGFADVAALGQALRHEWLYCAERGRAAEPAPAEA